MLLIFLFCWLRVLLTLEIISKYFTFIKAGSVCGRVGLPDYGQSKLVVHGDDPEEIWWNVFLKITKTSNIYVVLKIKSCKCDKIEFKT